MRGEVVISKAAEYALRAMAYLAEREGTFLTTAQIADATQTPGGYLAKVMETLCRLSSAPKAAT
jgi:DNA-binding IscR family transcriptional regulator